MRLILATRNVHKLTEIAAALRGSGLEVDGLDGVPGLPEDIPETGETMEENALQKARFVFAVCGLPVLADDSGIEIRALGWAPGVHSKRWTPEGTDEANNAHLLRSLVGKADRGARYRCVLALVAPGPAGPVEGTVDGICAGTIGETPLGSGGFGYDPLFWPDDRPGVTMAQLTMAEKNAISHRGRALKKLPALLERLSLATRPQGS